MYFKKLHSSYYVTAGKELLTVRNLDTNNWVSIHPEVGLDERDFLSQIVVLDSNFSVERKLKGIMVRKVNTLNHPRTVLSDFEIFEMTLRWVIRSLKVNWWETSHLFFFNLNYEPEGGLADIEIRAIKDSMEHCGAKALHLLKPSTIISDEQVREFYEYETKSRFFKEKETPDKFKELMLEKV